MKLINKTLLDPDAFRDTFEMNQIDHVIFNQVRREIRKKSTNIIDTLYPMNFCMLFYISLSEETYILK